MIVLQPSSYAAGDTSLGYGAIGDAISCTVTEVLNGEYTLEMVYPISGRRFSDLEVRRVILAPVVPDGTTLQPFRIMSISKPLDGKVTVLANHISYDLSGYIIAPVTINDSVGNVLTTIFGMPGVPVPFTPYTDKTTTGTFVCRYNSSIRSNLAGRRGSVLDKYGGEFEWDRFTVKLLAKRGANNGVRIEYAKNLTGLIVDTDANNLYSHVQAYWYDPETHDENHGSRIATGATGLERTLMIDVSDDYDSKPTVTTLNNEASNYIASHDIDTPNVSVDANFVDLSQTEEYKKYRQLEVVALGDTVTVYHAGMGVNITTRVKQTVYDVLRNRYTSIKLGTIRANIVDQIVNNNVVAKDAMTAAQTMTAIKGETSKYLPLTGGTVTGQIAKTEAGGAYWKGRDNSVTKTTAATNSSYFYPTISLKSNSGTWDLGTIGDKLAFHYQTDSDYSSQTNTNATYTFDTDGTYSEAGGSITLPVPIADGGTAATTAVSALTNLFGTSPTWTAPTLATYASAVTGGYVRYGNLVIVQLEVTSVSGTSAGGSNRSFLMGFPAPSSTAAMSICPTSANFISDVHAYIATNGRLNMIWASGVDMGSLSTYRVSGIYMI